jgi:AraC family transcriptional regulator
MMQRRIGDWRVVEKRHAAGERLPWHEHAHPYVTLALEGSYEEEVRGARRRYARGAIVVHPGGERHADRFAEGEARLLGLERLGLPVDGLMNRPAAIEGERGAVRALLRVVRSSESGELDVDEAIAAAVGPAAAGGRREPPWIAELCRRLESEVAVPPRLGTLARELDLDPSYLARAFRAARGTTIAAWSRRARIDWVRVRIAAGARDLAALALDAGFCDQSHLTRVFAAVTGTTPGRFCGGEAAGSGGR